MAMLQPVKAMIPNGAVLNQRYFLSRSANYEGMEDYVGVVVAGASEQDEPLYKTEELQGKGLIFRLTMTLETGKKAEVFCTRAKLEAALEALPGKTVGIGKVKSVIISRKARFF